MAIFDNYSSYCTTLLHNKLAQYTLRVSPYDLYTTIEEFLLYLEQGVSPFGYRNLPLYSGHSDSRQEFIFYLRAACLSYIPCDTAGAAYITEKLNGESLPVYRCKNALQQLKYMGIHLDGAEETKLYEVFAAQETNVFRLDPAGLAGLCLRVHSAVVCKLLDERGFVPVIIFSKNFGKVMEAIAKEATAKQLEQMDISDFLPQHSYTLTEDGRKSVDKVFARQAFPALYSYNVSTDEYVRLSNQELNCYLLGARDKNIKVGDKIIAICDNLQISAEITELRHYADYTELPHIQYGFGQTGYNPYIRDNFTTRENGGLTLAFFKPDERQKIHNTFTTLYLAYQLEGFEDAAELYLVRRELDIYMHVSYSSEFLLKECLGGPTIRAISPKPAQLVSSKADLLCQLEPGIPSIPTRKEIENDCFSQEDYENNLYVIKLNIQR